MVNLTNNNMVDVMLDIETLGTGADAFILSIGAVEFDKRITGHAFHTKIDPQFDQKGGKIDPLTVMWWLKQSKEAQAAITSTDNGVAMLALHSVLVNLNEFIGDRRVWGNGATFDNVIVSSAMARYGIKRRWSYRKDMCYRTIVNMFGKPSDKPPSDDSLHHDALSDAIWQAKHLQNILTRARIKL